MKEAVVGVTATITAGARAEEQAEEQAEATKELHSADLRVSVPPAERQANVSIHLYAKAHQNRQNTICAVRSADCSAAYQRAFSPEEDTNRKSARQALIFLHFKNALIA